MSNLYLTLIFLLLASIANAQDSVYVEYWDNQHVKNIKYFTFRNHRTIPMKDSLFYTDGTLWQERVYHPSTKTFTLTRYDRHGNHELIIPLN